MSTMLDVDRRVRESTSLHIDYEAAARARARQAALADIPLADGPRDDTEAKKAQRRKRARESAGYDGGKNGLDEAALLDEPQQPYGIGSRDIGGWKHRRASVLVPRLSIEEPA